MVLAKTVAVHSRQNAESNVSRLIKAVEHSPAANHAARVMLAMRPSVTGQTRILHQSVASLFLIL